MFFSPRARLKPLAAFCRRMAIATRAGLEDRRIWRDEAERGRSAHRAVVRQVSDSLARGESISKALVATGEYFPPLFIQMVAIGEASGNLDHTYRRLAEHYEYVLTARRAFWGRMTWPLTQLALAVLVIGLFIFILGMVQKAPDRGAPSYDPLGFGLTGSRGLVIYLNFVIIVAIVAALAVTSFLRGAAWTRPLARMALHVPFVGSALKTLALARFTWALQLVFDTPMDLRKALPLALDATANDYYSRHSAEVARSISRGTTVTEALTLTNAFPRELLDAIDVGERAGNLVETMRRQSEDYQQRAASAMSLLAQLLGYLVWALVAGLIIMLIFRIFSGYTTMLHDLSKPGGGI